MDKIEFGDPIAVNGVRPLWLGNDDMCSARAEKYLHDWYRDGEALMARDWAWDPISHIRLPADHAAYLAIAKGFEPFSGNTINGHTTMGIAPGDWDKGVVLRRNGVIDRPEGMKGSSWAHTPGFYPHHDIIGYRKRIEPEFAEVDEPAPMPADWAIRRAREEERRFGVETAFEGIGGGVPYSVALARYIEKHESAPVDPLVDAFNEIHGHALKEGEDWSQSIADRLRAALAKRGLEIRDAHP